MLTDAGSADEGSLHYENNTNKLYVKQSSGFFMLAEITNVAPTIGSFSEATGGASANNLTNATPPNTFTLTAGSNTVITINATDDDLETISYSATVTSGTATNVFSSPSFPVSNQSSNVFTLTPVTSGAGGTVTIRFDASDGTNVANVSHSFEIAFNIVDSHYTSLLMATDGSAGDNNDITDSSSSNHTITANGDAHAGTFSPYRHGGYSAYFDGTTNTYLNVSSSAGGTAIGSGDFTISFWVWANDTTTANYILDYRPLNTSTGNYPHIRIHGDGTFKYNIGGTTVITGNTAISSKQWAYFCLARDNGTTKMYVNGTLQTATYSGTESLTNGTNRPVIGTGAYAISPMFDGYISDLRVVTSLDTSAYSVPTERMSAITNTQLLTCHLPYIADGSSNGHSITVNGNTSTKPVGPYDYGEYSESDNGGAVYFDGSGDYLSVYDGTSGLDLGSSSAFTLEFWFYMNGNPTGLHTFFNTYNGSTLSSGAETLKFSIRGSDNLVAIYDNVGNANILQTTKHIPQKTWNHFCWTRSASNSHVFYLNGEQIGTSTATTSFATKTWTFGSRVYNDSQNLTGYMSDISLTKGSVTRSSAFTPPSAPLSSSGTTLHIKGTDAHVLDKSQGNNLKLVGAAAVTNATNNSNISSTNAVYFDGTNDYLTLQEPIDIAGDFTFEVWIKPATAWSGAIGSIGGATNGGAGSVMRMNGSGQMGVYSNSPSGVGVIFNANQFSPFTSTSNLNGATLTDYAWTHLALSRSGSTTYLFVNGYRNAITGTGAFNLYFDMVGAQSGPSSLFSGYIQDLRVSSKARYTAADETSNIPSAPLKG